jgi:hypothetical protein
VQSAALAAGDKLSTYYSTGSTGTLVSTAQTFAQYNMPAALYGTVVPAANVVIGTWNGTAFTSGGTLPNAVQVTGLNTAANGNPVPLFFGSFMGRPTVDIRSTVVASYTTGRSFNTIVINDLSQSFSSEIASQRAADNAILNCVKGATGTTSQFGITSFNGTAAISQPLTQASTHLPIIQSVVTALESCGNIGAPACSGSNVAAGLASAIQQFRGGAFANASKNIVVITDGVPNQDPKVNYTPPNGNTTPPICPPNRCTDADLLLMAQAQAALAKAAGISISTIYYSGDTPIQNQASYAASVASLVTGSGIAMVAPTPAQISSAYAGFCSTIPSALKTAM